MAPPGVGVHIKLEGLEQLLAKTDGERMVKSRLRKMVRAGSNIVRNEMRTRVPRSSRGSRRKGSTPLYRTIQVQLQDLEAKIGPKSRKAHFVEKGTRPHAMKPRRKRALAFGDIVVASVRHPGSRARPFLEATERASKPAVDGLVRDSMREIEHDWSAR